MYLTIRQAMGGEALPAPALPQGSLMLHIGRHKPIEVTTADQASRIWQIYRDSLNLGGSESPAVLLKHGGKTVGYVSYNGRVWEGPPKRGIYYTQNPLVAEASRVGGIVVGDWLPVEDMTNGHLEMMMVVRVWDSAGAHAITIESPKRGRIYYRTDKPGMGHDRYFTNFINFQR